MKCPHCNKKLVIPEVVYNNVECYGQSQRIKTGCCGKIVIISRVVAFEVFKSDAKEDNWGNTVDEEKTK